MHRSRLIAYLIALVTLLSGALIVASPGAGADTANPEITDEGWFARTAPPAPQVPVPCEVGGTPIPRLDARQPGCGPTSVASTPTPQSKTTGHYVVSSAGGTADDESNASGDTAWAAFNWDLSEQSGATVTKFVVTLAQGTERGNRNQGDTYTGTPPVPPIQACNILEPWAAAQGSNPWDGRPNDGKECVVPTTRTGTVNGVTANLFTFDVTNMARSWVASPDPRGYGFVIKPGRPDMREGLPAFQITFSGYYDEFTKTKPPTAVPPQVAFEFTPAPEEDIGGGGGFDDLDTGGDELFEDITTTDGSGDVLEAMPDLDVIPTDEGSDPLVEEIAEVPVETAAPVEDFSGTTRTRPISRDTGFPWIALLLLPLVAVAFWGTGTALGPVGDPVPARRGGVSRVLAQRQAANGGSDLHTR